MRVRTFSDPELNEGEMTALHFLALLLVAVAMLVPESAFVESFIAYPVRLLAPLPQSSSLCGTRTRKLCRMSMAAPVDVSGDGGVTRVVRRKGTGKPVGPGDIAVLKYSGKIIDTGLVFTRSDEYRCTLNDGTMISGWDAGLGGLNVGDEATIRCSPRYGYGDEGVPPVVPPGATLEFDVQVLENEGNIMNPNTFADTNPLTPRTPDSIRTEFLRKQEAAAAAMGPEAEGFAKVLQWFKSIYVFGLFEGQTGEEAPWYLRPLITFPIMFAISGAAFLVVYALNGISTNRSPGGVADDIEVASTVAAVLAAALGDAFHA